jgi:hypothetical protein
MTVWNPNPKHICTMVQLKASHEGTLGLVSNHTLTARSGKHARANGAKRSRSSGGGVGSRSAEKAFQDGANFLASGKGQKVVGGQSSKRVQQGARRGEGGSSEIERVQQVVRGGEGGSSESGSGAGGIGQSDAESAPDDDDVGGMMKKKHGLKMGTPRKVFL